MSNTNAANAEAAVAYAALILTDASIPITPEKLQTLLQAAGIEDVEPIWTKLFANALKDKNLTELITAVGTTEGAGKGGEAAGTGGQGGENEEQGGEVDGGGEDGDGDSDGSGEDLGNLFDLF